MSNTFETEGTILRRHDGDSPGDYDEVPGITSIDPVGFARSLIDVTTLRSSAREYKLALKDGQEINVEAWFDPKDEQHIGLRADNREGAVRGFQIELADDSPAEVVTFEALVMNWNIGAPIDNVYPLRFTLKPTGDMFWSSDDIDSPGA